MLIRYDMFYARLTNPPPRRRASARPRAWPRACPVTAVVVVVVVLLLLLLLLLLLEVVVVAVVVVVVVIVVLLMIIITVLIIGCNNHHYYHHYYHYYYHCYYHYYYGRFPKFHRVFLGRDPGTLKSDIVSNKHPQLICSDSRLSN